MMKHDTIESQISNLLDRQFELNDIRTHLASIGYDTHTIDDALKKVLLQRANASNKHVSTRQGLRGFQFILAGIITLLSIIFIDIKSDSPRFDILRIFIGILAIVWGIIVATRPLKDSNH
ncbi:MAG: hypothetical protein K2P88_00040 [Chitinophagaceae bacterium]|uniref:hypothetical protein n=1 Tax=unclassified Paraflavitalea TaxID=2798305 RepID=UPI003D33020A|nr:hypothetical protein [Chitinophagaceae bacterium]